ncbi:MAG: type III secretion protein [Chlamydia sp. 32-24]|nr:MAG: type III secretion protein [Chlamydia sp. 32-24]
MQQSFLLEFIGRSQQFGSFMPFLALLVLFMARIFPIITLAPFFGAKVLPHSIKVVFGLCLFVIFLPELVMVTKSPLDFNVDLIFLFLKELFIGAVFGFIISIPFMIVQNAGILIDHQRGGSSLMVNDPTMQNQSSPFGTFFNLLTILLFFSIDGPFTFINALVDSYQIMPPDGIINASFFEKNSTFLQNQIKLLFQVMSISIRLASPALIIILMTDFFLGIANRLAPQVQITFLGMPLKSLLAILIVFLGLRVLLSEFSKQCIYWLNQFTEMSKLFHT